ncbi:MAG: hypothetical protein P1V20_31725 [Verrucomicrobiales bacterium]|nr:hypothetical protein [Verrucomicrobiales bacterium]
MNHLTGQLGARNRISQSPDKFSKLSKSQKTAVKQGQVCRGMSKDAVCLAWGKPDQVQKSGKKVVWIYMSREQVDYDYTSQAGNLSRYFSSSEKYYDGHSSEGLTTVERLDRTVVFERGRVVSVARSR